MTGVQTCALPIWLLLDVSYDENGDLDRESYLTTVANGTQVVREVLPPVGKK